MSHSPDLKVNFGGGTSWEKITFKPGEEGRGRKVLEDAHFLIPA